MPAKDPYPEIGQMLVAAATAPWERIVLEAEVGDDWGTFQVTSFSPDGAAESLDIRPELRLLKLLQEVRRITSNEIAPGKERWRTLALTLRRDGSFDIDFGY